MKNQFDLEQDIMHCWTIVDDIKALHENESDDFYNNYHETKKALQAIEVISQMRFNKLFNTFEKFIAANRSEQTQYHIPDFLKDDGC